MFVCHLGWAPLFYIPGFIFLDFFSWFDTPGFISFQISHIRFQIPDSRCQVSYLRLQTSYFRLHIPDAIFQNSYFIFQISGFRIQISAFRFPISDFRFQISDFRFHISDFRFRISAFRIQMLGELGFWGRGNRWAGAGGTRPGDRQSLPFKILSENPIGSSIDKSISSPS